MTDKLRNLIKQDIVSAFEGFPASCLTTSYCNIGGNIIALPASRSAEDRQVQKTTNNVRQYFEQGLICFTQAYIAKAIGNGHMPSKRQCELWRADSSKSMKQHADQFLAEL